MKSRKLLEIYSKKDPWIDPIGPQAAVAIAESHIEALDRIAELKIVNKKLEEEVDSLADELIDFSE